MKISRKLAVLSEIKIYNSIIRIIGNKKELKAMCYGFFFTYKEVRICVQFAVVN